jgi:uncharacterized protein YjbI with pentapeptide repeats
VKIRIAALLAFSLILLSTSTAEARTVGNCEIRPRTDCDGQNLAGADLRGADLRNASLKGAILINADLRGADLRGANLNSGT